MFEYLLITSLIVGAFAAETNFSRSVFEGDLFEGDILLSKEDLNGERNAIRNMNLRWPGKTVYYVIDNNFNQAQVNLIKNAMNEYHTKTCIRFVQGRGSGNYIRISSLNGCYSMIGRQGGVQTLSLQIPGCMHKGVIMHELMHALGFWHEQTRADRDNYVNINWNNILEHQKHNFNKNSLSYMDHMGFNYDYISIMHYEAYLWARDNRYPTMTPKNTNFKLSDLGSSQRNHRFSPTDIAKLKKLYQC